MCPSRNTTLARLALLAGLAAFLPFLTIHVSYLLAAANGHVEWCFPYLQSCTSISATGRLPPEKWWFKGMMIPTAVLTAWFWWRWQSWLHSQQLVGLNHSLRAMWVLGLLAALFLTLYTLALGEAGDTFRSIRRIGVTLSFTFTYLAQLLSTRLVGAMADKYKDPLWHAWHRRLFLLMTLLLAVGLLSVALDAWLGSDYEAIEDAFEWVLALLLNLYFAALAWFIYRASLVA